VWEVSGAPRTHGTGGQWLKLAFELAEMLGVGHDGDASSTGGTLWFGLVVVGHWVGNAPLNECLMGVSLAEGVEILTWVTPTVLACDWARSGLRCLFLLHSSFSCSSLNGSHGVEYEGGSQW
jgi:hypothetical protein